MFAKRTLSLLLSACALLGAAGTAAAIAHKTYTNAHTVDIKALQQKLKDNGAVL